MRITEGRGADFGVSTPLAAPRYRAPLSFLLEASRSRLQAVVDGTRRLPPWLRVGGGIVVGGGLAYTVGGPRGLALFGSSLPFLMMAAGGGGGEGRPGAVEDAVARVQQTRALLAPLLPAGRAGDWTQDDCASALDRLTLHYDGIEAFLRDAGGVLSSESHPRVDDFKSVHYLGLSPVTDRIRRAGFADLIGRGAGLDGRGTELIACADRYLERGRLLAEGVLARQGWQGEPSLGTFQKFIQAATRLVPVVRDLRREAGELNREAVGSGRSHLVRVAEIQTLIGTVAADIETMTGYAARPLAATDVPAAASLANGLSAMAAGLEGFLPSLKGPGEPEVFRRVIGRLREGAGRASTLFISGRLAASKLAAGVMTRPEIGSHLARPDWRPQVPLSGEEVVIEEDAFGDGVRGTLRVVSKKPLRESMVGDLTEALGMVLRKGTSEGPTEMDLELLAQFQGPLWHFLIKTRDVSRFAGDGFDPERDTLSLHGQGAPDGVHLQAVVIQSRGRPSGFLVPLWFEMNHQGETIPVPWILGGRIDQEGESWRLDLKAWDPLGNELTLPPEIGSRSFVRRGEGGSRFRIQLFSGTTAALEVFLTDPQGPRHLEVRTSNGLELKAGPQESIDQAERASGLIKVMHTTSDPVARENANNDFYALLNEVARSPARRAVIAAIGGSPFPVASTLIRIMEDSSGSLRDLVAEILLKRPYEQRHEVLDYDTAGELIRLVHIVDRETQRKRLILGTYTERRPIEVALAQALDALPKSFDHFRDAEDAVIDVVLKRDEIDEETPDAIARALEDEVASLETRYGENLARVWRITFIVDEGLGRPLSYYTLRNRTLYERAKAAGRATYYTTLPGDRLFVEDPVIRGIHPVWSHLMRLYRLGAFKEIRRLPTENIADTLLELEGRDYYMASLVTPPEEMDRSPGEQGSLAPGLLRAYERATGELRKVLGAAAKRSSASGRSEPFGPTSRLYINYRGLVEATPEAFEAWIAGFARETIGTRDDLFLQADAACDIEFTLPGRGARSRKSVSAIARIIDTTPFEARVEVSYMVEIDRSDGRGPVEVLIPRTELQKMEADKRYIPPPEACKLAQTPISRKDHPTLVRQTARSRGALIPYDQIDIHVRRAFERLWRDRGMALPASLEMWEIFIGDDGSLKVEAREPAAGTTAAAAFLVNIPLPSRPKGVQVVYYGNDVGKVPLGAMGYEEGRLFQRVADDLVLTRPTITPFTYLAQSAGARMEIPESFLPHWNEDEKGRGYLTGEGLAALRSDLGAARNEDLVLFRKEGGRYYVEAILRGGLNSRSLVGSALSAGASSRLRRVVPTFVVANGTVIGIASYDGTVLGAEMLSPPADSPFAQRFIMIGDAMVALTGLEATERRFAATNPNKTRAAFGGAVRLMTGGVATDHAAEPSDAHYLILESLDALAAQGVFDRPTPRAPEVAIPREPWGGVVSVSPAPRRPITEMIAAAPSAQRAKTILGPAYDTRLLIEGTLDPASVRYESPGAAHHALVGTGTVGGRPVGFFGVQQIPEVDRDAQGKVRSVKSPGASLYPASSMVIARFFEGHYGERLPIIGFPGILGFNPVEIPGNLLWGSRIVMAMERHDAPIVQALGPDMVLLGGGYVVVAPAISAWGHIELWLDPGATLAVLEPGMWLDPGFGKRAVAQVAARLKREGKVTPDKIDAVARQMVVRVVRALSSPHRAQVDGSITGVLPIDDFPALATRRVGEWYDGRWEPVAGVP